MRHFYHLRFIASLLCLSVTMNSIIYATPLLPGQDDASTVQVQTSGKPPSATATATKKTWWAQLSPLARGAIVVGSVGVLALVAYKVFGPVAASSGVSKGTGLETNPLPRRDSPQSSAQRVVPQNSRSTPSAPQNRQEQNNIIDTRLTAPTTSKNEQAKEGEEKKQKQIKEKLNSLRPQYPTSEAFTAKMAKPQSISTSPYAKFFPNTLTLPLSEKDQEKLIGMQKAKQESAEAYELSKQDWLFKYRCAQTEIENKDSIKQLEALKEGQKNDYFEDCLKVSQDEGARIAKKLQDLLKNIETLSLGSNKHEGIKKDDTLPQFQQALTQLTELITKTCTTLEAFNKTTAQELTLSLLTQYHEIENWVMVLPPHLNKIIHFLNTTHAKWEKAYGKKTDAIKMLKNIIETLKLDSHANSVINNKAPYPTLEQVLDKLKLTEPYKNHEYGLALQAWQQSTMLEEIVKIFDAQMRKNLQYKATADIKSEAEAFYNYHRLLFEELLLQQQAEYMLYGDLIIRQRLLDKLLQENRKYYAGKVRPVYNQLKTRALEIYQVQIPASLEPLNPLISNKLSSKAPKEPEERANKIIENLKAELRKLIKETTSLDPTIEDYLQKLKPKLITSFTISKKLELLWEDLQKFYEKYKPILHEDKINCAERITPRLLEQIIPILDHDPNYEW